MSERETLLDVKDLKKYFPIEKGFLRRVVGHIKAVDGVDFYIKEGETLGLVGESGCGKSTLGKCVLRGIEPTSGEINIRLNGEMVDVNALNRQELRMIRRHMQMIFQDPFSSLDPRMTVLDIVGEPLVATNLMRGQELRDRVAYLMEIVGLEVTYLKRYPHAFSGGQRQRLGIARALASNPKLVVADEPVSALDVSVQAQILNLLQDLQAQFNLTYLFVSHDLSVVEHICDRVSVMYVGKMVELAETEELFANPKHPYTEALLSAIPTPDPEVSMERILLPGEVANPADPPTGCYFHPRCSYADEICRTTEPVWDEVEPGHFALCHFAKELQLRGAETQLQKKGNARSVNLFIIFLIVITFFLLLIKLIASLIGRVSERLLTNHFRNLETLLEHDQLPVDWGEKLEKIAQGGGAHILFVRQLLWDEEAKSFLMKKILALYKFFENSPFVESQEARELLLEQLETVINRWEGSEVPEILAYYDRPT